MAYGSCGTVFIRRRSRRRRRRDSRRRRKRKKRKRRIRNDIMKRWAVGDGERL